jgi:hypothetical protein
MSEKFIESTSPHVNPYKQGYTYTRPGVEKGLPSTLYMTPNADERVRMQEIRNAEHAADCVGAPVQQAARLLPLYSALFDDAMGLAPEIRDPFLLRSMCYAITAVDRRGTHGTVGSQIVSAPGENPQEFDALGRAEPRCLPLMTHPQPVIHKVTLPNPSTGGGGAAAPAIPPR